MVMWTATNIDGLVVLTALFLRSAQVGSPRPWQIAAGQYLGSTCLIAVSLLAAIGLMVVPESWIGLLGLLPLALGIYGPSGAGEQERDLPTIGVLSVVSIVVANGADNLSVYSAAFRVFPPAQTALTVVVFLALIGVWCLVSRCEFVLAGERRCARRTGSPARPAGPKLLRVGFFAPGQHPSDALAHADQAMYQDKRSRAE
ncbi:cadmium resistance transporter [Saccharopolyspora hattusasensis]|uniref:cadmium resistance transporter n=1 Tax=Saccharopolyspora hattusasensis TaxID=1128679 RepID=UPI003D968A94